MRTKLFARVVLFLCGLFTATTADAVVLSVNIIGGQGGANGAGSVTTNAGFFDAPNWNNVADAANPSGSMANPILNNGNVGAAQVTWDSSNTWAATNSTPPGGGNATMMSGYLDNFGGRNITVTGLSSALTNNGYNVIVYFNDDSPGSRGFLVNDGVNPTQTRFGFQQGGGGTNFPLIGGINGFITSTDTASNTTNPSNAVLFTGLTGSNLTITGVNGTTGDGRSRPNGFQIVSANTPFPQPPAIPPSSGMISINFAGGSNGDYGPHNVLGVAGVVPLANWNNPAGTNQNDVDKANFPLIDNTGFTTSALLTIDAGNTFVTGGPGATDNDRLLRSYIDNAQGQLIRVANLDPRFTDAGYDIIVYFDTDSNGVFSIGALDTNGNTDTKFAFENGNFAGTFLESLETTEAGAIARFNAGETSNFVRLTGFDAATFQLQLTNGNSPGDDRARISGIQIIAAPIVPEPATLSLLGLAGLALLRRRRHA